MEDWRAEVLEQAFLNTHSGSGETMACEGGCQSDFYHRGSAAQMIHVKGRRVYFGSQLQTSESMLSFTHVGGSW